jgi:hypothetical protein
MGMCRRLGSTGSLRSLWHHWGMRQRHQCCRCPQKALVQAMVGEQVPVAQQEQQALVRVLELELALVAWVLEMCLRPKPGMPKCTTHQPRSSCLPRRRFANCRYLRPCPN